MAPVLPNWCPLGALEGKARGGLRQIAALATVRATGAGSRPRPVPPDYEIVKFFDTGGEAVMVTEPTFVERAIVFLMRTTEEGWLVAGFEEDPPQPGWPPKRGFGGY